MRDFTRRDALKFGAAALAPAFLAQWPTRSFAEDPHPYDDAVLTPGEPPAMVPGSYTLAVLPDTQYYCERFPKNYLAQSNWILANQQTRNISAVLHLGDITNRNTHPQWENAREAMSLLDGHLPYFFTTGNHDYSDNGSCKDRQTFLNDYFPLEKYKGLPTFGGVYDREPERMENSYHLFSAKDREFLVLALEFGPRKDVIRWANEVVDRYPNRSAILVTHVYMYSDDTRYSWQKFQKNQAWNPHAYALARATEDDVADGEELWDQLVSRHSNFILTLNGHVCNDGLGRTATADGKGRDVHQLLVNFQMKPKGGDGWLRLLEFRPDHKTVQVYDYSPTRNEHNRSAQNEFAMQISDPV